MALPEKTPKAPQEEGGAATTQQQRGTSLSGTAIVSRHRRERLPGRALYAEITPDDSRRKTGNT